MAPELCVLIADPARLAAIRGGLQIPGRIMPFTSGSLVSAMESIRAYRPQVVAIEALFAESPAGAAFADRIEAMGIGTAVRLVARHQGRWVLTLRNPQPATPPPTIVTPPTLVALPVNTRRAPRFRVRSPLEAVVEGGRATLINLSVYGAQLVSLPPLRPNQKIKVGLADTHDMLNLLAQVAWSMYERPGSAPEPYYRVGLEFNGAAQQTLESYRLRYCADQPLPISAR